jgi:hypothetical protein
VLAFNYSDVTTTGMNVNIPENTDNLTINYKVSV